MLGNIQINKLCLSACAIYAVSRCACVAVILNLCEGHFVYTLDDPYIHLSVARQILTGGYGINAGEFSSPSSSILWPWLLSAGIAVGGGSLVPLILDAVISLINVALLANLIFDALPQGRKDNGLVILASAVFANLACSAAALALTGLEHPLHILLVMVALRGLIRIARGSPPEFLTLAALVLMPLARLEGLAFAASALAALLIFTGYRKRSLAALVLMTAALGADLVFTILHKLPAIPTSITLKSDVASGGGALAIVKSMIVDHAILNTFHERQALVLEAQLAVVGATLWLKRKDVGAWLVLGPIAAGLAAHILAGPYGWFGRYEVYAIVMGTIGVIYSLSLSNGALLGLKLSATTSTALLAAFGAVACLPYALTLVESPAASMSVYDQQYQMRRYAQTIYKAPVGVNDLGLVSYGNDHYVLDLYGLGSYEVAKLRANRLYDAAQMDRLTRAHDVGLVMIYPLWFPVVPKDWRDVASLTTPSSKAVTNSKVEFFSTPVGDRARIAAQLRDFARTLPPADTLTLH